MIPPKHPRSGVALVIVLAMIVLLTGLVIAFFSRATAERALSSNSGNQLRSDLLARSALEVITASLRQEIQAGSQPPASGTNAVYIPQTALNVVPQRSGTIPSLIRFSVRSDTLTPSSNASAVNSVNDLSLNKRSISPVRWNKHYLLNTGTNSDSTPSGSFAPDWVIVTRSGPAVLTAGSTSVVGRYAFAIYDQGGLLDLSVAGYPANVSGITSGTDRWYEYSPKGNLAYADLTAIGLSRAGIERLVAWRNWATANPDPEGFTTGSFTNGGARRFLNVVVSNTNGFLSPETLVRNGRTDQKILSRQDLLELYRDCDSGSLLTGTGRQFLTHFTREVDAPTPNPPLIVPKKRFPLSRLNWLTYSGSSASRGSADPDIQILTGGATALSGSYGVQWAYLQQGTATNIQSSFGLLWNAAAERWNYVGPTGSTPLSSISGTLSSNPNFFEILQATISGTMGTAESSSFPTNYHTSTMQVLAIGANLIAQARPDSYPTRIGFTAVSGTVQEVVGCSRLPYINGLAGYVVGSSGSTGGLTWLLAPSLWNPYYNTRDPIRASTSITSGTYLQPRPDIRIVWQGNVSFPGSTGTTSISGTGIFTADGRDGYIDPARITASHLTTSPAIVDTNAVPGTINSGWGAFIVGSSTFAGFRVQLPGSLITTTGTQASLRLENGFQVSMEYLAPSGNWRSYSFLQGNNDTATWMPGSFVLTATNALTGTNAAGGKTVVNPGTVNVFALDTVSAPCLVKADPRSLHTTGTTGSVSAANLLALSSALTPAQDNGSAPYTTASSRPVLLNRPFRSVGEMGYAYRDQPFRTLNFSSTTSPDAKLLDYFCVNENGNEMRAGTINLNTRQSTVLAAMLQRAMQSVDPVGGNGTLLSTANAKTIADSLVTRTTTTPMLTRSDLVNFVDSNPAKTVLSGTLPKAQREVIVRALAEATQTRTWNLLIDVIAQTGRYPTNGSPLKDFAVQGESRYWLHLAIDRYTGKIIDRQLEQVSE